MGFSTCQFILYETWHPSGDVVKEIFFLLGEMYLECVLVEPLAGWARIRTPLGITLGKIYYCVYDILVDTVAWHRDGSQRTTLWSHFSLSSFP